MARALKSIVSLNGGEMSPLVDSRVDLAKYASGCREMTNAVAQKYGGATRRPGFYYLGTSKYGQSGYTVRLQAFKLSTESNYCIEFGHEYCRFIKGNAYIYDGDYIYEIVSPYTALTTDVVPEVDRLQCCQINNALYLTHPDHPVYKLTRISDTNWTLAAVEFNVPALMDQNPSEITIAAGGITGSVSLAAAAKAWASSTHYQPTNAVSYGGVLYACLVDHISTTFAADLSAGYWEDQVIFDPTHVGSTWQLSYLRDANEVDFDITTSGISSTIECLGSWEVRTYGVWSADIAIERSDDYGTTWQTVRKITGRSDRNVDVTGTADTNALFRIAVSNYSAPSPAGDTTPRVVFEAVDALLSGLVRITAVSDSYNATGTVVSTLYAAGSVPDPTPYWSEAAWSDYRGYPCAVTAHEQRIIYGGSAYQPQRLWGTYVADIENFDRGDGTDATAGFAIDIATVDNSPIRWLASGDDLMVGMSNGEWVISTPDTSQSLSATNIKARQQSDFGSNTLQAMICGDALVYVDRFSLTVRQFLFSIATNKYMSSDLTALAEHITYPGVSRMDAQKQFEKYRILWFICGGYLIGLTYDLEQQVVAWHRHTGRPDKDAFLSVACVYGAGSDLMDEVYVAVRRTVGSGTSIFIEHLGTRLWEHESFFDPAPVVWGQTWGDGGSHFQWYGFKPFGWIFDGLTVPNYYLVSTGSGFSEMDQWAQIPYAQASIIGSITAVNLGGSIVTDVNTGVVSGTYAAQWLSKGNFCSGSSWRGSYGGYTGDTTVDYTNTDFESLLPWVGDKQQAPTTTTWTIPPYPNSPGHLITYCGNPMWGAPGNVAQLQLSSQMTVAQAAANGGTAQQGFNATTTIQSYDPSTGLEIGQISILNLATKTPSRTGYVMVTFTYEETPIGGGSPVTFAQSQLFPVGVGGQLATDYTVPGKIGYSITCTNVQYQDVGVWLEDFSQLADGWYGETTGGEFVPNTSWLQIPTLGMADTAQSVDDFRYWSDGVLPNVSAGENWPGVGTFGQSDYAKAYDDFSAYPDGDLGLAIMGIGWKSPGTFGTSDYVRSEDDFSGYTDGTYDTLANLNLNWVSGGTFGENDYLRSTDDFSSYADGTYSSLTGGSDWVSNGTFG